MSTATVALYENDNTTPVLVGGQPVVFEATRDKQVLGLSGNVSHDDAGTGTVRIKADHQYAAALTEDRIVRVMEDGRTPLAFFTDSVRRVRLAKDGPTGRVIEATGEGVRSVLRRGRLLPWLPLEQERPLTTRRVHGGAAPGLDTSGWSIPIVQNRISSQPARPIGMPSNDSRWIWGEAEAPSMTVGDCWVRRWFEIVGDDPVQVVFLVTADDIFDDWLHGAELQRVEPEFPAEVWHKPWRSPMLLNPGTYVYTVHATNQGGKAGIIAEAWTTTATGIADMIFMTGVPTGGPLDDLYGEWQVLFNPPEPPGMTPGAMFIGWLDECHARGELLDVEVGSFTAELDSAGEPWAESVPLDADATGTVEDAFDLLCASYVDGFVSRTDGLVVDMWNKDPGRGTAKPINIRAEDRAIVEDVTVVDGKVENDVLLVHDKGMRIYESPLSILAYGRRPGGKIQCGSITDPAQLDAIGLSYLLPRTTPQESRLVTLKPVLDFDADTGDTVQVEGDELRVMEIGFELHPTGRLTKQPALSTPYQERVKRADRLTDRLIRQFGSSMASARVIDTGTGIPSGSLDPEEIESWSWIEPDELDTEFWDLESEDPVGWQEYVLPEARRLWGLIVKCKWAEPDGAGGLTQVTTGQSRFLLKVNNAPTSPFFIATVPEVGGDPSDPTVFGIAYIFGEAHVPPLSTLSIAPLENGGHIEGSASIWGTVPL